MDVFEQASRSSAPSSHEIGLDVFCSAQMLRHRGHSPTLASLRNQLELSQLHTCLHSVTTNREFRGGAASTSTRAIAPFSGF